MWKHKRARVHVCVRVYVCVCPLFRMHTWKKTLSSGIGWLTRFTKPFIFLPACWEAIESKFFLMLTQNAKDFSRVCYPASQHHLPDFLALLPFPTDIFMIKPYENLLCRGRTFNTGRLQCLCKLLLRSLADLFSETGTLPVIISPKCVWLSDLCIK